MRARVFASFITISTYFCSEKNLHSSWFTAVGYFDKSPDVWYTGVPCNRLAILYDMLEIKEMSGLRPKTRGEYCVMVRLAVVAFSSDLLNLLKSCNVTSFI